MQCLDTGEEFSVGGAEDGPEVARAFADTLLQLLGSLTEPVIPISLHAKCAQAANRDEAFEVRHFQFLSRHFYSWYVRPSSWTSFRW